MSLLSLTVHIFDHLLLLGDNELLKRDLVWEALYLPYHSKRLHVGCSNNLGLVSLHQYVESFLVLFQNCIVFYYMAIL